MEPVPEGRMSSGLLALLLPLLATGAASGDGSKAAYEDTVKPFLRANCLKCHGPEKTLAGLRLDTLGTDFLSGKTGDVWREVYDRLGNGTMPPKKELRPDAAEAAKVTDWIIHELRGAEKRAKGMSGRIPTRRLNRTEYANTLRDLFFLEENVVRALERDLPMDGTVDGFDRGGAALFIDGAQMARYLETADAVLSRGVFAAKPKWTTSGRSYPQEKVDWRPSKYVGRYTDLAAYPDGHPLRNKEQITVPLGANWMKLTRGGLEFVGAGYHGEGGIDFHDGIWQSWNRPWGSADFADGWYRMKCRAGAFKGTGKHAADEVRVWLKYSPGTPIAAMESVVIDAPLEDPREFEMMIFLRAGTPDLPHGLRLGWNGGPKNLIVNSPARERLEKEWRDVYYKNEAIFRKKPAAPKEEVEAAKKRAEEAAERYHKAMREVDVAYVFNPEVDLQAIPRLWIEWLEIEGPVADWPPRSRTELFFDGEDRAVDEPYIREIFARFLPRAYRRPVGAEEVDAVAAWVLKARDANQLSGSEAVREGVRMVLCSPGFLLLQEPAGPTAQPRRLTDHELACRLSYFLWSTMPDAELLTLAAKRRLSEPGTLRAQVLRMIADPKAIGFVRNFTGQWLKVRDFDSVITDRNQYKSYDEDLRESSRREPAEFFQEVLRQDLSILNFIDSDFLVINSRLAAHYGIEGVSGGAFRRVSIGPERRRGGVLGMAGVLTFLTDGLRTLPVRRGAYVLETLWNAPPPPPPPNVGDLPPVGKVKTVRERLELHRQSDSCASCHAKIDPFGIALENYDAIGAWRDRQNGERFKNDKNAPLLDVSGTLPSGRAFQTAGEFKRALMAEKDRFVRGFVEKVLSYALGRPVGAADRGIVDEIIRSIESSGNEKYRMRSLLQAVVSSPVFQTK
jgi:mono/diheme cytochrome c family protein